MGEVWRASDTTLGRDVALKILPPAIASDLDRRARFEREAKILANLNHPGIATVYGFHHDGEVHFLVLELVAGEDLEARLARGPVPPGEALSLAARIAEALEYAHERGVIHRDLKPANVKLAADGSPKLLDFGLAKAVAAAPVEAASLSPTSFPTMTSGGTAVGLILGTAAYMSPEQARGRPLDRRTDIWAFGCVLFELLTGHPAFHGETATDVLAAILTREPDYDALPPSVPPTVRTLLRRCLDKDARTRLRDIGEARIALAEGDGSGTFAPSGLPGGASALRRSAGLRERAAWIAVVLLFAGAAGWGWFRPGARSEDHPLPAPSALRRLTELPGPELHPDISPDGRQIVYDSAAGGNTDIYLLRVGGDRAIDLTADSPGYDGEAAFSPDGERIAFRSDREGGGLFVMGATGESVRRVTTEGHEPSWSPDGTRLAFVTESTIDPYSRTGAVSSLWIVQIETGKAHRIYDGDATQPAWAPRGGRIAFWANTDGQRDLWTIGSDGGAPVAVTADPYTDWSPEWSPDGNWLYFSSDRSGTMNLWRVRIDPSTGRTMGEPEPVTTSVRGLGCGRFSASGTRMAIMAFDQTFDLSLYELDPSRPAAPRPIRTIRDRMDHLCSLSNDGAWLACSSVGAEEDLVLLRADGGEVRRFTNDTAKDRMPIWSPDGAWLAFTSTRAGRWEGWLIRSDGSGLRQATDFGLGSVLTWTGDAGGLMGNDRSSPSTLWRVDTDQPDARGTVRRITLPPGAEGFAPMACAPTRPWIAGAYPRAAADAISDVPPELSLFDPESGEFRRLGLLLSGRPADQIAGWLPDGRQLIVHLPDGLAVVEGQTGASRLLLPCEPTDHPALSHDGRRLLVEHESLSSDIWMVELERAGATAKPRAPAAPASGAGRNAT